jgi:hypothetical protein
MKLRHSHADDPQQDACDAQGDIERAERGVGAGGCNAEPDDDHWAKPVSPRRAVGDVADDDGVDEAEVVVMVSHTQAYVLRLRAGQAS